MTTPTAKNPNDAFAYLTNESGAKSELVRIAALVDLQVGTPDTPAELHVTGRFSQSVALVQAQENQTLNFPANFTLLCVEVVNPKENSQIYVNLPDSPRLGQLCYVKDESGTADICNLVVQSNSKINSSNNTIIDFKNGCIGFTWLGESWTIITSSGSSTIIEKTIVQEKTTETIISSGGGGGGSGDVVGPSSSTDNAIARFDLTTGKLIQNSGVTISDANNVVIPGSLSIAGGYGSSGVTISTAGNVQANGNATFDGSLTVTGGTTSVTDAILGNAAVGSFPYFDGGAYSGDYAIFSHKDLDNSSVATNYAIYQDKTGNTSINASDGKTLYFAVNNVAMGAITNNLLGTGIDSILFTGDLSTRTNVLLGNNTGASSTTIHAGTGGIVLSASNASTIITGSSSGNADAYIGSAEVGTHPYWGRNYAMFSHKDMDNSVDGNAALIQSYDGDTFLGAKSSKTIYVKNGTSFIGKFDNDNIELTGDTSTSTATILGNSYGLSSTNIHGGLFGITLSGSATTTITGSSSGQSDAYIGSVEIGTHPYYGKNYALFGHKDLDHSVGTNYALVQGSDGTTYINSPTDKSISFRSNATELAYFYYSSFFNSTQISLQGIPSFNNTVTIGSSWGGSSTSLYGGTGGILLSGSGATTTITGSAPGNADAYIGSAEIGVHPYWGRNYAMFSHKDMDNSVDGNASLIQSYDGDTFLGAKSTKSVYLKNGTTFLGTINNVYTTLSGSSYSSLIGNASYISGNVYLALFGGNSGVDLSSKANISIDTNTDYYTYFKNNGNQLGYIGYSTLFGTLIDLKGRSGFRAAVNIGNSSGTSLTNIYAGTGGITLSGSATSVITGSSSGQADAYIGSAEIGVHPYWGANYAMFSHKDMDNSVDGNASLIQSYTGDTFLGSKSTKSIFIKNGTSFIGKFDNDNIELTGDTSTSTATIIGNSYGLSSTSIYGGLFGIYLSGSAATTITGSSSTQTDAIIGMAAVGELPATRVSLPNYFSMFGHKNLDQSTLWNYAVVQNGAPQGVSGRGDTFINSPSTIYFQFSGSSGGLIGTLNNNTVSFTGLTGTATTTTLGNTSGASSTTIQAGTGDITLSGNTSGTDVILDGYVRIPKNPTLFIDTITPEQSLTSATTNINWSNTAPNFFDNSSGWDNTNKNWTVPKTGRYEISISLLSRISSSISADVRYIQCTMYNSGTTNRYTVAEGGAIDSAAYSGASPINYYQSIAGSGVYALTSSHKVAFQFSSNANNSSVFLYNGSSEQKLYIKYLGLD